MILKISKVVLLLRTATFDILGGQGATAAAAAVGD